ncbi:MULTISPECIES: DUF7144 family membrane protein [unclassified Nocardioides]|uniref:DUF7144 family membrane protein n=1 Tax=unclassified Nocardioides TaxID=2615069 RepID=UPI0036086840
MTSSHELDPRSMQDAQDVSNFNPGLQPKYVAQDSGWVSWVQFAAVLLFLAGSLHVIEGLVAIFRDEVFLITRERLVINLDYTAWGWFHLIMGVIMILVGAGLLSGRMIARIAGVAVAFISALLNITFMSAYPMWSVILIAIDVLVIWAIMVHGGELKRVKV